MLWIIVAFVLGELLATPKWWIGILGTGVFILCFWLYMIGKEERAILYKIAGVFFLFLLLGIGQMNKAKQKDDYFIFTKEKIEIIAVGEINKIEKTSYGNKVYVKHCKIYTEEETEISKQFVTVFFSAGEEFEGKIGNQIKVRGNLQAFSTPRNPGEFDAYSYYKAIGIDYTIKSSFYEITDNSYSILGQFLFDIKSYLLQIFSNICVPKDYGVFAAVLLGEKQELDIEIKSLYQENGISHILAISGLHISLIGMGIYALLRKKLNFLWAGVGSAFFMGAYVVLTGEGTSSLRAYGMFLILLLSYLLGRTYDMLSAASLSAFLLLWNSPFLISHSGFLLSFGAVFGIGAAGEIFKKYFHTASSIQNSLFYSISVFWTTLPILSYFYFEIAPYSVFLNLLIIPCMGFVVISGLLGGIGGIFSLKLGQFLIGLGHLILTFYEQVCKIVKTFPKASILLGRSSWIQILFYYIFVVLFLFYAFYQGKTEKEKEISRKEKHKRFIYVIIISAVLVNLLSVKDKKELEIAFLDVSQGDGIYIKTPSKTTYFIDGGSSDISHIAQNKIIPFLKSKGKNKIDYVMITHTDSDHISGILELLETNIIEITYLVLPDTNLKDNSYQNLADLAEKAGTEIFYLTAGDMIIDGEVSFTCLHPDKNFTAWNRNEYSMVLGLVYGRISILLTGDLEENGEEALLEQGIENYNILKIAHHGSKNSTKEEFLQQVNPEIAIISCGIENKYGHPHIELMERLKEKEVYQTNQNGAIIIKTDGYKKRIETMIE